MRYGADGGGIGRGTSVNGPKGGGREVDGAADGMRWIGCQRGVAGGSWKTKSTGGRDDMDGRTGACSAWNGLTGSITVAGDSPGLRAGQQLLKRWVRWTRCRPTRSHEDIHCTGAGDSVHLSTNRCIDGLPSNPLPKIDRLTTTRNKRLRVEYRSGHLYAEAGEEGARPRGSCGGAQPPSNFQDRSVRHGTWQAWMPGLRAPTTVMGVPDSALRLYLPAAPTNRPGHRLARGSVSPSFAAAADSKDDDHDDCAPPSPPPAPLNRLHIDTQRRASRHGSSSHATTLRAHSTPELSRRRQSTP
ncbi:hypothetical protein Purlil1_6568 [Purpureocillium lilacinum]|uniref:Uncharacterized protein n=1 Tax=Purpureocillium lilacinum TaxID=33203 RepID=A0ABR0BYU7_PURLI|nr:hypothetical protein Purlil1_6568 [Purpureocillium lilacinum]